MEASNVLLKTIFISYLWLMTVWAVAVNEKDISPILKQLFGINSSYEKSSIPIENDGQALDLKIGVWINNMVADERLDMHFSLDFFLNYYWKDYRLKFDLPNVTTLPFDYRIMEEIWVPNIYFLESKGGAVMDIPQPNIMVTLSPDGSVHVNFKLIVTSFCPMDLRYYPFDIQKCNLTLLSNTYSQQFLNMVWATDSPSDFFNSEELYIQDFAYIELKNSQKIVKYPVFGDWSELIMEFTFHRNAPLFLVRDFLPCTMIVILSWTNFWINYRSTPARTALGITTVLTIVTMTNTVRTNSPSALGMIRSLDYYMFTCNLFVFAALFEGALVGMTAPNEKQVKNVFQQSIRKSFTAVREKNEDANKISMSDIVSTFHSVATEKKEDNAEKKTSKELSEKITSTIIQRIRPHTTDTFKLGPFYFYKGEAHIVDIVSRVLFPVVFLLFNCIFFIPLHFNEKTVLY